MNIFKNKDAIYYTKKQVKHLIPLCDHDGNQKKGRDGSIYEDPYLGKAIKIYHRHIVVSNKLAIPYLNNVELKRNNVVVPEKKVYVNYNLKGFSMELVKGFTISEIKTVDSIPEISFSSFFQAYNQALTNLSEIANLGILVKDFHDENIMYDVKNHCLKFIDIEDWNKLPYSLSRTISENIDYFIRSVELDKVKKKLKE